MTQHGRTLAALVALGLAGAGIAAPAHAATSTPKPKTVSLKPAQYPRLIDNPGRANDVIRFTLVQGVTWKIGDKTVLFDGLTSPEFKVSGSTVVTAAAGTSDGTTYELPAGTPSTWTFDAPSVAASAPIDVSAASAVWNDMPGATKDTVTLTKVPGMTYTVTTGGTTRVVDVDDFKTKPTLTLPATETTTVVAALVDGYAPAAGKTIPTFSTAVTGTPTVAYTKAILDALITVGENPFDATKGFGPGAAVETVKIVGAPGLKFTVGSRKPIAVSGVTSIPVAPEDIVDGHVKVTVQATSAAYSVPATYENLLDFADGKSAPAATVADTDVTFSDLGGTSADTLTLKAVPGMTWWLGQDVKGKIVYTAQKPNKDGVVVYKVKHATKAAADEKAVVNLKPVANRGWVLRSPKLAKLSYEFTRATTPVPTDNAATTGGVVTLKAYPGITSWAVKYTTTTGTRSSSKSFTVKASDITAVGAAGVTIPLPDGATAPTVKATYAKDYTPAP